MHKTTDEPLANTDGSCKGAGNCAQCQSARAISQPIADETGETAVSNPHNVAGPCATKRLPAGLAP